MWIRGQNKKQLVKVKDLWISTRSKNYCICTGAIDLGYYSTEEKAIKVLDMIQGNLTGNKLQSYEIARDCPVAGTEFHGVFQMPQDSEVK